MARGIEGGCESGACCRLDTDDADDADEDEDDEFVDDGVAGDDEAGDDVAGDDVAVAVMGRLSSTDTSTAFGGV